MARKIQRRLIVADSDKCDGCGDCVTACAQGHFGEDNPAYSKIKLMDFPEADVHVPILCQSCDDPVCVKVCPMSARSKQAQGPIETVEDKCIGCRACLYSCYFGAPSMHPETGRTMSCAQCIESEPIPFCVKACKEKGALKVIDAKDIVRTRGGTCAENYRKIMPPRMRR